MNSGYQKNMKVQTFSIKGVKTGDEALPKEFSQKVNLALLSQVVHVYEERGHIGLRKTKTRAEVNRTTKKIYKQKGTGGARHGSRRANLYVGGGVALGPRPIRRILTISGSMKSRSKLFAYSLKASEGKIIIVSDLSKVDKTKVIADLVKVLGKVTGEKRFTFILSEGAKAARKFFRNLKLVNAISWKDANAYDILNGGIIAIDSEIFSNKKQVTSDKNQETSEKRKVTSKKKGATSKESE
jgi:large subunit ribosomal protein L4